MDELELETAAVEAGLDADASATITWALPSLVAGGKTKKVRLKMPTLAELLASQFPDRQHLLFPWLREQESCMVYADTGVGKSLFALSAAIAIVGGGEFLGWKAHRRASGEPWRVLYIDGEMHIADIQERARTLLEAVEGIDREQVGRSLRFLARQHQDPGTGFPLITDGSGMEFVLERVRKGGLDLIVLDNFSTLGEVEDENSASSFNAIQQFLLSLKVEGVATLLVHHAGKSGDFRGSSKLAATFETIIKLERLKEETEHGEAQFRVVWDKVRAGGPTKRVREVVAKLTSEPNFEGATTQRWEFEAAELSHFDELKEQLGAGAFQTQKEIADEHGVSKTAVRKWLDKGIRLGLWTERQLDQWFAKGKQQRRLGKTQAPERVTGDWRKETNEDRQEPNEDRPGPNYDF